MKIWRGLFDLSEDLWERGSSACGVRVSEHHTHWLVLGMWEVTGSLFPLHCAASARCSGFPLVTCGGPGVYLGPLAGGFKAAASPSFL